MNILYINGHPNPESFHAAIEKTFVEAVATKHSIKILSLGKETFDPILRFGYNKRMPEDPFIEESQALILWADHIIFAFPIWWGDAPTLLRGWIDRVFTPGVTYQFDGLQIKKLLKGKTADIIVTSRSLKPIFWLTGIYGLQIMRQNIFAVTGIRQKKVIRLGGVGLVPKTDTTQRRLRFLQRVSRRAASL